MASSRLISDIQAAETDVRADSPTSRSVTINTWPETPDHFAVSLLAKHNGEYLSKDYDVYADELRHKDGMRMVVAKVFASQSPQNSRSNGSCATNEHSRCASFGAEEELWLAFHVPRAVATE